jgi:lysophospholipid acyltransferase
MTTEDGRTNYYKIRKLDITTILMMDTCKWTSFAWCIVDGLTDESKLNADQKIRKISKMPSFFEYFGYIFFYTGCLAGVLNSY